MASVRQHALLFFNRNIRYNSQHIIFKNQCALNYIVSRKICHVPVEYNQNQDPAPKFFNEEIQNILKELTRINMNKVFRHRCLEDKKLETPTYKFMTDDELKTALEQASERANEMLQMPPVIKVRQEINEVLSVDPALHGYDTAKWIFTDITHGISNRDRLIVIRDTEGNLIKADWDTRQRMNQIYFPQYGRELNTPRMFSEEQLKSLLERKEYEFILDRACVQFEPDDPEYQRITSITYQHLNEKNDFEILRSTRHFGPLAFYLAWFKTIDNLLLELTETAQISDANFLIRLYNNLHNEDSVGSDILLESNEDTRILEKYIAEKSTKKGQLELALQSYKELLKQRLQLEKGIKTAHGVS